MFTLGRNIVVTKSANCPFGTCRHHGPNLLHSKNMNTDGKVSLGTLHCSDVRKFETSTMLDGAFHSIVCDTASGSGEFASNNWKAS